MRVEKPIAGSGLMVHELFTFSLRKMVYIYNATISIIGSEGIVQHKVLSKFIFNTSTSKLNYMSFFRYI